LLKKPAAEALTATLTPELSTEKGVALSGDTI